MIASAEYLQIRDRIRALSTIKQANAAKWISLVDKDLAAARRALMARYSEGRDQMMLNRLPEIRSFRAGRSVLGYEDLTESSQRLLSSVLGDSDADESLAIRLGAVIQIGDRILAQWEAHGRLVDHRALDDCGWATIRDEDAGEFEGYGWFDPENQELELVTDHSPLPLWKLDAVERIIRLSAPAKSAEQPMMFSGDHTDFFDDPETDNPLRVAVATLNELRSEARISRLSEESDVESIGEARSQVEQAAQELQFTERQLAAAEQARDAARSALREARTQEAIIRIGIREAQLIYCPALEAVFRFNYGSRWGADSVEPQLTRYAEQQGVISERRVYDNDETSILMLSVRDGSAVLGADGESAAALLARARAEARAAPNDGLGP